jgi:hypothetical protein
VLLQGDCRAAKQQALPANVVQTVPNGYTLGLFSRQGSKGCTHTVRKLDSIEEEEAVTPCTHATTSQRTAGYRKVATD